MTSKFAEKVVLVTGAGSGIGRQTAITFAKDGAKVIVSDINANAGQTTVDEIIANGANAIFVQMDVSKSEEVKSGIARGIQYFGRLDCAVNNAGIGGRLAPTADIHTADWDKVLAVNLTGVWNCMKYEIPHMLKLESQCAIVNVSSIAGLVGMKRNAPYTASKHGVIGLTKSAALEYANNNLRINAVCPAFTDTAMLDEMSIEKPDLKEKLHQGIPMNRLGNPQEIADAILYLCSDKASFITGHAMPLDGGLSIQ
ncbi:MAG: glucose 1-dehydrogenase [Candidatus Marinimicrobia bacterium]|jgi:NAD(P)-dependent dehydrogenase (short-subunit alcohol dehydrogenase family)|nr:glucose 1-dehydrogenase [Candidatus Neomarinimicrobiota bacterium]MBT3676126.1 glucose 1-dehydrogenase [Candidatus Neomarinimicrobiota bacterium]MBT3763031.1 glucose 1-dehydrogenase [Candidatus Neomarinimicrobiota bacterium]MBT4068672.1 glucose 1-dehydrogenase [Candidatus Neomarinimicrobiota bacterium]MBT4270739.1 glucose 1-dehydrogenase [Candidatus Neomarinimicrobiota bacterium]